MKNIKPGNVLTIIYTSGTTGVPKGAIISHDAYTWNAKVVLDIVKQSNFESERPRLISYLPLSHIAA